MNDYDLNITVAEEVLGLRVVRTIPAGFRREVILFYRPSDKSLIAYSCDTDACNAMMFRNGKDDGDGFAPPHPNYATDLEVAWTQVLPEIADLEQLGNLAIYSAPQAARRICEVAIAENRGCPDGGGTSS